MSRTLSMSRYLLLVGALVMVSATARAQGHFEITAVARLGDPISAPATLVRASEPKLNDAGEILFRGDGGLLLTSPDGLTVVAAPGDVVPDGRVIAAIGDASVNASGQVAFVATLEPSGAALLLASEGTISEIAQVAVVSGRLPLRSPSLNNAGDIAFINGGQILLYSNGATTELVRLNHPALYQGIFNFGFSVVRLNDAGHVAFSTDDERDAGRIAVGVYSLRDGEVRVLAHPGIAAPAGGAFGSASAPSLSTSGEVAFYGTPSAPSQPGIFLFSNDTLTQIAGRGDVVEGHLLTFIQPPSTIGPQGQIAFAVSDLQGLSRIFLFSGGLLRRLVGDGDHTGEGDVIASGTTPSFNTSGELAFVDSVASLGRVYRLALDGTISRAAGEGDAVPVTPRIVSASTSAVRHNGQPVFLASIFPGESGIFDLRGSLIARVGDAASGDRVIARVMEIASSDSGGVAFTAVLSGPDANFLHGLFLAFEGGTLSEIVRSGSPAPGGGTFSSLSDPSVNASGAITFTSSPAFPPFGTLTGTFLAADGTIAKVAQEGDSAPDGRTFDSVTSASINDSGQVAFRALLSTPPSPSLSSSLWLSSGGELSEFVRAGDPAPGGGTFGGFGDPQLNSAGRVVFQSLGAIGPSAPGLFSFTSDEGIRSVVRQGDPAPGGNSFLSFDLPSLNSTGDVAFSSGVGVFLFTGGSLEVIARIGDTAPGGDAFTFVRDPKIGADAAILFTGNTDSIGTGVYLARRSAPEQQISIDIRPAGSANRIDPVSTERIPVAILSDADFDAQTIIVDTVRFGPTGTEATPVRGVPRDVDGDGDIDLVVRFRIQDTGIQCGQTSARITGQTVNNVTVSGSDAMRTVRCQ